MTKPIIGILANQRLNIALDNIPWTYVPTGFIQGVTESGGIPLIIPMSCDEEQLETSIKLVDKLILIGGQNVDPRFYGQEKAAFEDDYSLERDHCELAVIAIARRLKKPLFTVCRGTQLVNVALGGNLNQDITNHWQTQLPDETTQTIETLPGSIMAKLYGQTARINSYHRQSINRLAEGLEVTAWDPSDGTIEAVVSTDPDFTFFGVQWHPELLHQSQTADKALFDYLVNQF